MHYYGEAQDTAELEAHLASCEACRAEYQRLQRVLNTLDSAPVPERPGDYGSLVWQRIAPRISRRRTWFRGWLEPRQLMFAGAMAAVVVMAFLAGRFGRPFTPAAPVAQAVPAQTRERVLLVAVGDHLERSQMILAELANAQSGRGNLDISYEQSSAEDLLEANRIYRQTANSTGDIGVATLLDDLERVLLEIANSPSQVSEKQLNDLRRQIQDQGILFKVRVFSTQVQERESAPATGREKGSL